MSSTRMLHRERTQRQASTMDALVRAAGALNDGFTSDHVALALVECGRAMLHLVAMDVNDGEHARQLVERALGVDRA